jgi:hypothetical protein
MPRARLGKIARLPLEIRRKLNRRMADNEPAGKLLTWLNALPETKAILQADFDGADITPQNLSEWRSGGYQDWVREQQNVENIKEVTQYSMALADASGDQLSRGAVAIAAGKLLEMIETAPAEDLEKLVKSITALRGKEIDATSLANDKRRLEQADRSLQLEEARFQRQTAELFLKWYTDKRASEIAEGKGKPEVKIAQLRDLMFGAPEA